jgi:hypothetical protein
MKYFILFALDWKWNKSNYAILIIDTTVWRGRDTNPKLYLKQRALRFF